MLPAAQSIFMEAMREGLLSVFLEAGAVVGPPTCGACSELTWAYLARMRYVLAQRIETSQAEWDM